MPPAGCSTTALPGYRLADERVRLGFHPDNPVNLPVLRGIQVELPPGLRGIGDFGEHLVPRQDEMVDETIGVLVELAAFAGELIELGQCRREYLGESFSPAGRSRRRRRACPRT